MQDLAHILEQAAGVSLPADYRKFLSGYAGGARLTDGSLRYSLAPAAVLAAPFPFDRPRIDRPLFEAHVIYLGRLRDAGVLIYDAGGTIPKPPEAFDRMVTIGFAEHPSALDNGQPPSHVVVLDPQDGSVRLVPIDAPAVVRTLSPSFGRWYRKVSRKPRAAKETVTPKARKVSAARALAAFKRSHRLTLPPAYDRFLRARTFKRECADATGRTWQLANHEELADTSHGLADAPAKRPVPFARCAKLLADRIAGQGHKWLPVVGSKKKFTLARLRKAVCIGAENGDPLLLDATDDYSVWTLSQEHNHVTHLAGSFAAFVKPRRAKKAKRKPAKKPAPTRQPKRRAA